MGDGGDFDEILYHHEKLGGNVVSQRHFDNFHEASFFCGLGDLEYSGCNFTWCNNQEVKDKVLERIDRFVAGSGWMAIFLIFKVEHLRIIAWLIFFQI